MGKVGQGIYTIVQNVIALQHIGRYNYAYDTLEYTEDNIYIGK